MEESDCLGLNVNIHIVWSSASYLTTMSSDSSSVNGDSGSTRTYLIGFARTKCVHICKNTYNSSWHPVSIMGLLTKEIIQTGKKCVKKNWVKNT